MGAACLLHDARFDPAERLAIVAEHERRRALPVADRVPHDRQAGLARRRTGLPALRRLVSAGEPLNPEVMEVFRAAHAASTSTTATARRRPAS